MDQGKIFVRNGIPQPDEYYLSWGVLQKGTMYASTVALGMNPRGPVAVYQAVSDYFGQAKH